jgi:nucleoside-diphosphate-sugar epimerase
MTTILVTGANGFVGKSLCAVLTDREFQVKGAIRTAALRRDLVEGVLPVVVGDIHGETDWQTAMAGVDVVIHLAARAHVMRETVPDALQAFRTVNADGTENLARQAAKAGVNRFIFLSSIKVLGESTAGKPIDQGTPTLPLDPYALSKWEAEQCLQQLATITGMQVVVVRPPLVYGAGVKGNFLRLMQLVQRGWPLPFACISNKRSLVYVSNLCALLSVCIGHPAAVGQTLLVADLEVCSTPELIKLLATAMQVSVRLWPIPVVVLKSLAGLLGKRAEVSRLCDSLQVDATHTYHLLNWQPPYTATQGIAKTVAAFLTTQG